jgi:hypothetical protein
MRLHTSLEDEYDPHNLTLLHTVASKYPSLTHLHLIHDPGSDHPADFVDAISRAVRGWNQLRQLSVRQLSPDALYHVAMLPTLEWLELTEVPGDILLPLFSRSSAVRFFPCLQKLEVRCDAASFAIGLVEAISSSSLASICIESFSFGESWYQYLINAMRDCCSQSLLESMSISGEYQDESIRTSVDIEPLFIFSNLTSVKLIGYDAQLELDDTQLKDMALAWPHITSLILRCPSRVTLCGLVPLAQYCLKLQYLDIFFDPCRAPPPDPEFFAVKNAILRDLDVSHSPVAYCAITEPTRVAAFIHSVFPRARLTCLVETEWDEVADKLRAYSQSGPRQMMDAMGPGMSHQATTQQVCSYVFQ